MDQREIEALMEKHRQPAIMAYRPYPPVNLPAVNSHLGGCPALPAGYDWPRMSSGEPLHFLAQIDCAELPPSGGVLPDRGALFFFARIDEEMLWGDGDPNDDCRVVFAPRIGLAEAKAPGDLPPLMGGYSDLQEHFALPNDPPVNLYPHWPLVFRGLNSWPDISALGRWDNDYQAAVRAARGAEVVRVLDLALNEPRQPGWNKLYISSPRDSIMLPADAGGRVFPQMWVMVDRIARYLVKGPLTALRKSEATGGPTADILSTTETAARRWIDLAKRNGPDEAVDPGTAKEFATWLHAVANLHHRVRSGVQSAVAMGMRSTVQCAAASPSVAALIPSLYYEELESEHRPARLSRSGPATAPLQLGLSHSYHQLLGNAKSTQQARSVERDDVLLLQLNSDDGVNFMFCDVGEVEFWIDKRDLAARRFDKVSATTCGG
jgi:uncharacterized protein YwqG